MTQIRWTSEDLKLLPLKEGNRYEIIDGELYVSTQPSFEHQSVCLRLGSALLAWNKASGLGRVYLAPGIIFPNDDNVAPDLAWASHARLPGLLRPDGRFHAAPDLVVEVLSPGPENHRRDRHIKLSEYSRQGVREYWIVDWELREVALYRRDGGVLVLTLTLGEGDTLTTPLLPGFALSVAGLFVEVGSA